MKVLLQNAYAAARADHLRGLLSSDWSVHTHVEGESPEKLAELLGQADALIVSRYTTAMPPAPKLRVIQSPVAGYDKVDPAAVPAGCVVCNVHEHEIGMSEYVMHSMLEWTTRLSRIDARFRAGSWEDGVSMLGPTHGELSGKTLGIIGLGVIGLGVARRASAFDMRVIAATRTPRKTAGVESVVGMDQLDAMLPQCDFVLVACPLSAETRGLLDARRLGLCRPNAVIINVARGEVVDEEALYNALRSNTIGGAVVDVWYNYPTPQNPMQRPSRFPIHELPNVIMTPHCAAWTDGLIERRWAFIAANLKRFARGEKLRNIVIDKTADAPVREPA